MVESSYVIGVDLGQLQDYTAVAVVGLAKPEASEARKAKSERERSFSSEREARSSLPEGSGEATLEVVHLERFRGVRYPDVVASVKALCEREPLRSPASLAYLVVDSIGVGVAVTDMLREAGLSFDAVTITAGDRESREKHSVWRVPKRDLISGCQVLLQQRRLKIAHSLPEAETLMQELLNFRYKVTDSANLTYEAWRKGAHDDLLLALSLATWKARKTLLSSPVRPISYRDFSLFEGSFEEYSFGDFPGPSRRSPSSRYF